MGTPAFAVPILSAIAEHVAKPVLVASQPDKPKGRGQRAIEPTAVKTCAQALGLPLIQPQKIKTIEYAREIASYAPDVVVVAAYGRILTEELLSVPRLGFVNVHASLLPAYRGAAPINWAIIKGETRTGVTVQNVAAALDAGDILHAKETGIGPDETAGDLYGRLAALGAEAVLEFFEKARAGIEARLQDESGVSFAPPLSKADGLIDWSKPAPSIHNLVRGTNPWPGAHTKLGGLVVKVHKTRLAAEDRGPVTGDRAPGNAVVGRRSSAVGRPPGEVAAIGRDSITVATGGGLLDIIETQAEGARRMKAAEFARGRRLEPGAKFG
jgi:methionyl-tRNA formyltransferase